ncbi:MAG: hypothetical protein LJF30_03830 [Acidobacteria bacterium]|nr:hypothetical protein [Acidobacteriota bacterium]
MRDAWRSVLLVLGVVVVVAAIVFLRPKAPARGPLTPEEAAVVSAFTGGTISRESPIRVVFNEPLGQGRALNTPLESSPFRFEPRVEGVTVWTSPNRIEFRPEERLEEGRTYAAHLDLGVLLGDDAPLPGFDFTFAAMRQSFSVTVDGLVAADLSDIAQQRLTGRLVTADVEADAKVEEVLTAFHQGRDLEIAWDHHPDRRRHAFTVMGIVRDTEISTAELRWDGAPIGVDEKASREVEVPGLDTFTVNQARPVQGREQYVELHFTDPLHSDQNLAGLIAIGDRDDLRFVTRGNLVEIYGTGGFSGELTVRVAAGVRNVLGYRMKEARELGVAFEQLKPQVRFAGRGVIVPTSANLTVPIEAVNLRAVVVEAIRVPEGNVPWLLQVNDLDGDQQLNRVGRVVWKKTLSLATTPDQKDRWVPVGLDLSPLVAQGPGGLYRLALSFRRPHVVWPCDGDTGEDQELTAVGELALGEQEDSYWDAWWQYEGDDWRARYEGRHDPCQPGYYERFYDHDIRAARNVLVSDVGLVAKASEDGTVLLAATDLRTATPLPGTEVTLRDYQQETVASGRTGGDGLVRLAVERPPFLAVARHGRQAGYLRLDDGSALSMAHFDVSGSRSPRGLKGFLYGERGVWRPGDTLHLAFILHDPTGRLRPEHPLRFELLNPRGQVVRTITRPGSTDGFTAFEVATPPDAPTGSYTGRVTVGGAVFEKRLKIETVMPNRLKIALDFGRDVLRADEGLSATLSSSWLHGATARHLEADVELSLSARPTRFDRHAEYVFDDPTRRYATERQTVFHGTLDATGQARVDAKVTTAGAAPGMLRADFTTRVFEPGGAFSTDRFSLPFSPYARYIGIRTPRGDRARGMLLTDTPHEVAIVAVDAEGRPVGGGEVELKLYKVDWRWWWEQGEQGLAAWAQSTVHTPLASGVVALEDGAGTWTFEIKQPDWGRYLITAADRQGGHRTGQVVYVDWPGWAGRGRQESPGANILSFSAEKEEHAVGETVTLVLPTPRKGRALVSLETGSSVLRTEWVEATGTETRYRFRATPEMAPTVYAHVTLLQPHGQTANDLPLRLYGVTPIEVLDPGTRLQPVVECAEVLAPESSATVTVREATGRPMTYTLAVVDEGLLGLTRFETPNPWDHFYAREALGVKTWDLYDQVVGAWGGVLERMLAIGGDEEGVRAEAQRANRFPPMVRFLGPFRLPAGSTGTHEVDVPQYVGSVRVMVVAGRDGAFGAADREAFVRRPLMVLATLPRVLGPEEEVALPVSVFAMEPEVRDVAVAVATAGPLETVAPSRKALSFEAPGDQVVTFLLRTTPGLGVGQAKVEATSKAERATQTIELDVRMSTQRATDVLGTRLEPGATWEPAVELPGLPGTNEVTLEVSRTPPLDLGRRLGYLLRYPHGCVEQTVSSAFPQLFLGRLLELSPRQQDSVETNVKAALQRLQTFQTSGGGFGYWPGDDDPSDWVTSYAGHFVLEAKAAGYLPPPGMLDQWTRFQGRRARAWVPGSGRAELVQAYRLFTLALAGSPELGAMNQLRERASLPVTARWRLAATYELAGQPEAADALARPGPVTVAPYRELGGTFGSDVRDRAMILEALLILGRADSIGALVQDLSRSLSSDHWLSTQETAYALLALARSAGQGPAGRARDETAFSYAWGGGGAVSVSSPTPLVQRTLEAGGEGATLVVENRGETPLYPRLVLTGLPAVGREKAAANGLRLAVAYLTTDGDPLDPERLDQGTDFKAIVTVTSTGERGDYEQIALSHVVPSGWEIHNERLGAGGRRGATRFDYQDIRDDRVYTYFALKAGETKTVEVRLNASYLGRFYLPPVSVEAMYDATIGARVVGRWVEVVEAGSR